ncbi:MAG: PLP-dependent aminotransferase family protein [Myxococcota bacterium]|nr:PLP-dependent aminotransferase family protein [Myxococcota bacterium]
MQRTLGLVLDPAEDVPLYQQLFDRIAERIRSGAFPAGFRLPPSRKLAIELGTHRNTVVRAYSELERSGFLSSTVGRGTFVRAQPIAAVPSVAPAAASGREGAMPWGSLVSARARAEPFTRFHRITRSAGRGELINLTRMQPGPDLVPDELFRRCLEHVMRTVGPRALGYAPHEGVPRLRERIAADLVRQGVPARPDDVLVTSGSQQAIDVIARGLVDDGDVVLAQESTYTGAIQIFAAAGGRLCGVPSDAQGPDMAWLRNLGRAKAIYLMPNHCNPTGACISAERRGEIVAWSRETGTPIVEDDYAADLELEDVAAPPAMRALDGDVIYVGTFSKKLIPALRIGFLLCPPSLAPQLVALKHATDLGTSGLLQHALAEFLERGYLAAHLNRVRAEYRARRDALVTALRKELPRSVRFDVPARGTTLWLELPEDLEPEAVFEEARRRGVLVSPGTLHRVDRTTIGARSGVRLVFCYEPTARLVEGAKRLGQAFDALAARKPRRGAIGETFGIV